MIQTTVSAPKTEATPTAIRPPISIVMRWPWGALAAARPERVVVMPCGLTAAESAEQAEGHLDLLAKLGADEIWAVDAAATFSRPGPRLVEGVELLAHLLHPDRVERPPDLEFARIERTRARAG